MKQQGWKFEEKHGFSGSCGKTQVAGYMRGGAVKKESDACGGQVKKAMGGMVMPARPQTMGMRQRAPKSPLGGAMKLGMPKPALKAPISMSGGSAPSVLRKGGRAK